MAVGKTRLVQRFARSGLSQFVGESGRALVARAEEIDSAGDAGVHVIDRKPRDHMNAGAPRSKGCPIVLLSDAEGGDDTDAGDRDDRPAQMVFGSCHDLFLDYARVTSAAPSKR